jgi:hypothetical protein
LLLQLLTACAGARYDATLYSFADHWVDKTFLQENAVKGAYYRNENYTEESRYDGVSKYIQYDDAPASRCFIITTEEEYEKIFTESTPDTLLENHGDIFIKSAPAINFEEQMVIFYIRADAYAVKEYYLKKIELTEGVLTVKIKLERSVPGELSGSAPGPRGFMLTMDKAAITEVVFEEVK